MVYYVSNLAIHDLIGHRFGLQVIGRGALVNVLNEELATVALKAFLESTIEVLRTHAQLRCQLLHPYRVAGKESRPFDISGTSTFSIGGTQGLFSLCLPKTTFSSLMEKSLGKKLTDTQESHATIAEITDLITRTASKPILDKTEHFESGFSKVAVGEKMSFIYGSELPIYVFPFGSDIGPFHLEIHLNSNVKNLVFSPGLTLGLGRFKFDSKILIVDDVPTSREITIKFLQELGFSNFIEAGDGKEAWETVNRQSDIGLIISDWHMPGLTGLELVQKIRATKRFQNLPILMATGESQKEEVQKAIEGGVSNYILKPITLPALEEKLKRIK